MARHHRDMSSSGRSGLYLLFCVLALVLYAARATTAAETHYHDFVVQQTPVKRLCSSRNIITVNGMFPGPTLKVNNGDTLVINVVNRMQYNVTIHWHGVRQMRTAWADGPEFITQCPIRPGGSYTYRFTIQGQEGTLWWHAHSSWLRATVYGAIVIYPNPESSSYPFEKPNKEFPVILGEWWNANPVDVIREALRTGAAPNVSDAYTINGQPGDLYNCSTKETTVFPVTSGDIVLLRVINAALNQELFFSVAAHKMTVVAADASYLKPFTTNVLMLGPGETMDVIITADQPSARYYLAAHAYDSTTNAPFDNTTTTAILQYKGSGCAAPNSGGKKAAALPQLPAFNDTNTVTDFFAKFKSLRTVQVPDPVDEDLFFTVGLGLLNCTPGSNCGGPNNTRFAASMNNHSFVLPTTVSILQAHLQGVPGIFNPNFPPVPPLKFDYTAQNVPRRLWSPVKGTEVLKLKYGTTIQLVIQGTTIFSPENHPMHIHGYDFYILATGFGNFNPATDTAKFNLHDPPMKNTVAVPTAGWAAIRFVADNPGAWFMHCHLDVHLAWGLAMVFLVEDGVGELQKLEAPPADLPAC